MMRWQDWLPDERDEYDRWLAERIRQQTRGARTFAYLIAVALCIAMLLGR
ncbi:MAG: hypothetical protein KatS3mg015_2902 [Fimbriimonadales bacterium]|nr:MAG: hypothetical protein KatS3mg015_2902 [Fimbriimonadales bacterium]